MRLIRPSSLSRIVACPGSLKASEGAPDWADEYEDTTARDEGTACHWAAHKIGTGHAVTVGDKADNGIAIDQSMLDAVDMYLRVLEDWPAMPCLEHSLPIPQLPYMHGTPDAFAFDPDTLTVHLADLKYGFRAVEVWLNFQLLAYALAIAAFYHRDYRELNYVLTIVQPRRWHIAGPVRTVRLHGSELEPHVEALRIAIAEALLDMPPLYVGGHCRHCPGRARCAALQDAAVDGVYVDTHDLTFRQAEEELLYLERRQKLMEGYISGLRAQVEHGLRNGAISNRYQLRQKTGRLIWDAQTVGKLRAIANLMGVKIEKEPDLITPTQARAILGESVVNLYATRAPSSVELVPTDVEKLKRIFGK